MSDYEMLMVVFAIIGLVLIRDIDQKK
ncbi:hypothetical protein MTQ88_08190 [Mammaliicoccus sciuri]|nr:hypothetical protein [Mammaliicoccus sciuri]MCO4324325.1 hypothetical protein [Mammaliicoccus sciuri]MEB6232765.1 hypothetical protein [Mammaliicoccus sciuri]MEB7769549.1 hypothetical protein [Mammaliicoccus sciuri]MEB7819656.1 hypothetical protein [Mammaliicoccus sciuri]